MGGLIDSIMGSSDSGGGLFSSIGNFFTGGDGFDLSDITGLFTGDNSGLGAASIMSATSLLSSLYGSDLDEDKLALQADRLAAEIEMSKESNAIRREQLGVQRESIAAANERAEKANRLKLAGFQAQTIGQHADRAAQGLRDTAPLIAKLGTKQADAAARTGEIGRRGFADLVAQTQRGLLR